MSITNKLQEIINIKENTRQAIISKGVEVSKSTPFEYYPSKILDINTTSQDEDFSAIVVTETRNTDEYLEDECTIEDSICEFNNDREIECSIGDMGLNNYISIKATCIYDYKYKVTTVTEDGQERTEILSDSKDSNFIIFNFLTPVKENLEVNLYSVKHTVYNEEIRQKILEKYTGSRLTLTESFNDDNPDPERTSTVWAIRRRIVLEKLDFNLFREDYYLAYLNNYPVVLLLNKQKQKFNIDITFPDGQTNESFKDKYDFSFREKYDYYNNEIYNLSSNIIINNSIKKYYNNNYYKINTEEIPIQYMYMDSKKLCLINQNLDESYYDSFNKETGEYKKEIITTYLGDNYLNAITEEHINNFINDNNNFNIYILIAHDKDKTFEDIFSDNLISESRICKISLSSFEKLQLGEEYSISYIDPDTGESSLSYKGYYVDFIKTVKGHEQYSIPPKIDSSLNSLLNYQDNFSVIDQEKIINLYNLRSGGLYYNYNIKDIGSVEECHYMNYLSLEEELSGEWIKSLIMYRSKNNIYLTNNDLKMLIYLKLYLKILKEESDITKYSTFNLKNILLTMPLDTFKENENVLNLYLCNDKKEKSLSTFLENNYSYFSEGKIYFKKEEE